jgi:hypothetical protein
MRKKELILLLGVVNGGKPQPKHYFTGFVFPVDWVERKKSST